MRDFLMVKTIDKIFIFIITFLIFSNVVNYLSKANLTSLNTVHLFLLTVIFTSYMVYKKFDFSFLYMKLNWWIIFYLCVILFWFILPHNELSIDEFRRKILSIVSLFIFMVFIFYDNEELQIVRQAVLVTTLISVFNNIFEFINPFTFFPIDSTVGVIGRSAGFYYNPTISGGAIILGVILSLSIVPRVYRMWYILFSFIGVFLTFSRSAIIGFILVYLLMTLKKQLHFKYLIFIPMILFAMISLSLPFLINYAETTYGRNSGNIINRTMWFVNPSGHIDNSQREREEVAEKAFIMFAKNPFFGNGLASTRHWKARVSTHNIYLSNMAEIGLLGLLVYPLLIYMVISQACREIRDIAIIFACFTLYIGFFSHNILDELYFLFAFALIANMGYKSLVKYHNV